MSLSKRSFICGAGLAGLALLSGCTGGVRPLYSNSGAAIELRHHVRFSVPSGRVGYTLREGLEDQLGRPGSNTPYHLTVSLTVSEEGLAITEDDTIPRNSSRGTANYRLTGPNGFETITGSAFSMTGYSTTGSTYATRAAQHDAQERLAKDLARRISINIAAVFESRAAGKDFQPPQEFQPSDKMLDDELLTTPTSETQTVNDQ